MIKSQYIKLIIYLLFFSLMHYLSNILNYFPCSYPLEIANLQIIIVRFYYSILFKIPVGRIKYIPS